jgi:hypothetical protein
MSDQDNILQHKAKLKKFNFEKYLLKNKFYTNNNSTHMEHKDFYTNLINNIKNSHNKHVHFYLTNGTNKNLYSGGKGTNKAITIINKDFFILDNENNIFCPIKFKSLGSDKIQQIQQIQKENINCKNPGSVFYKEIEDKKYNIIGVYHINGWNHKLYNIEGLEDYKKLVSLYYIAILDHFFQNIYSKQKFSILHLI